MAPRPRLRLIAQNPLAVAAAALAAAAALTTAVLYVANGGDDTVTRIKP